MTTTIGLIPTMICPHCDEVTLRGVTFQGTIDGQRLERDGWKPVVGTLVIVGEGRLYDDAGRPQQEVWHKSCRERFYIPTHWMAL